MTFGASSELWLPLVHHTAQGHNASANLFSLGPYSVILAHSFSRDEETVLNLPPHQLCS